MSQKEPLKISESTGNKKIFFGDDGEVVDKPQHKAENSKNKSFKKSHTNGTDTEITDKWHQKYDEYNSNELTELKESELKTFIDHCKNCFEEQVPKLEKSKFSTV